MADVLLAIVLLAGAIAPIAPPAPRIEVPSTPGSSQGGASVSRGSLPPPPLAALSPSALRDELRAASQRRQDDLAAIARQRAELERLKAEVAAARAALESERANVTDKAKGGTPPVAAGRPGNADGANPQKAPPELAKALKGMKPDQAAAVMGKLDPPLAADLLHAMRPIDAGAVLDKMKPELAATLVSLIAVHSPARGAR